MSYKTTVGLEIHAELNTLSKMFCGCKNDAEENRPNTLVCPVCMAHPGVLPVINKEAVRSVLRVGVAVGGTLADYTEFDRKNYFYPDIPKGYQISQFAFPLVSGGKLAGVSITRIHLEEDTARSQHTETGTLVDFNRAGVPLMELVTDPVIHDSATAGTFGRELQLLLKTLGVSDADMEKGHMRLEANISVSKTETLGTKVEVKNINSFRAMEKSIDYEVARQIAILDAGGVIEQETRGWDDSTQKTLSQRKKEGSADYRYFPDPDLPSLRLSEIEDLSQALLQKGLPELPDQTRTRLKDLGIGEVDIEQILRSDVLRVFIEKTILEVEDREVIKMVANYVLNDTANIIRENQIRDTFLLDNMGKNVPGIIWIARAAIAGNISSRVAKDVLKQLLVSGSDPELFVKTNNLEQINSGDALTGVIAQVIADNKKAVDEFKAGKAASVEFLVGQCMKVLRGSGNPKALRELIITKLST